MNAQRTVQYPYPARSVSAIDSSSARNRSQSRPGHRERDFGVGYGTSSGYGQTRHYAESWAKLPFRCY
jgi:hypothetical protein